MGILRTYDLTSVFVFYTDVIHERQNHQLRHKQRSLIAGPAKTFQTMLSTPWFTHQHNDGFCFVFCSIKASLFPRCFSCIAMYYYLHWTIRIGLEACTFENKKSSLRYVPLHIKIVKDFSFVSSFSNSWSLTLILVKIYFLCLQHLFSQLSIYLFTITKRILARWEFAVNKSTDGWNTHSWCNQQKFCQTFECCILGVARIVPQI